MTVAEIEFWMWLNKKVSRREKAFQIAVDAYINSDQQLGLTTHDAALRLLEIAKKDVPPDSWTTISRFIYNHYPAVDGDTFFEEWKIESGVNGGN